MSVPLTEAETAQARQWAADLGVPEADVIAEATAAKTGGAAQALHAAQATMSRMSGLNSAYAGGPQADAEAEAG